MPFGDWDDPATWEQYYTLLPRRITKPATEGEIVMHYARVALFPPAQGLAARIEAAFGWTPPGGTVLFYGAAYSWTVEALEALGYTLVVGADPSQYIADRHDLPEEGDIDAAIIAAGMDPTSGRGLEHKQSLWTDPGPRGRSSRGTRQESGVTVGSRNRLKSAVGLGPLDDFDWVLSEYLIELLTDDEARQILPHYDLIGTNLVHIICGALPEPGQEPGNWKGPAGWRAFLDAEGFSSHQLLVGPTGEVL